MVIYVDVEMKHVGVDLVDFDAVPVFWSSLHISARRALATRGVDPDAVELANADSWRAGCRMNTQYLILHPHQPVY